MGRWGPGLPLRVVGECSSSLPKKLKVRGLGRGRGGGGRGSELATREGARVQQDNWEGDWGPKGKSGRGAPAFHCSPA